MRKVMILTLVMLSSFAFAQNKDTLGLNIPLVNGMVVYQKTFKASGKTAATLFAHSKTWFEKRYNDLDSIKIQNAATGQLAGRGWEKLVFKGPLKMEVTNRAGLSIEITSSNESYDVKISNIVLGYVEDPAQPRIYFTAEDMLDKLLGVKFKGETGYNPTPFKKNLSRNAFKGLNLLLTDVVKSINETMGGM